MGTHLAIMTVDVNVPTTDSESFLQREIGADVFPIRVPSSLKDRRWVRELTAEECRGLGRARTGDRLADGSVLLWLEDATRMGLAGLREWVFDLVCRTGTPIALGGLGFVRGLHIGNEDDGWR